jgi:hypothetical protein
MLPQLSSELLFEICEYLPTLQAVNSLLRVNRRLQLVLSPILIQRGITAPAPKSSAATSFQRKPIPGRSVLHQAVAHGREKLVIQLLASGAAKNGLLSRRDCSGATALFSAALLGQERMVELLLAGGAAVDERGCKDWTPLHCAVISQHRKLVGMLLEAGADPEALVHKCDALTLAVLVRDTEIVQLLIGNGHRLGPVAYHDARRIAWVLKEHDILMLLGGLGDVDVRDVDFSHRLAGCLLQFRFAVFRHACLDNEEDFCHWCVYGR